MKKGKATGPCDVLLDRILALQQHIVPYLTLQITLSPNQKFLRIETCPVQSIAPEVKGIHSIWKIIVD